MFHVFVDEGNGVETKNKISLSHCMELCSETVACKSFAYCSRSNGINIGHDEGRCHLKNKVGSKRNAVKKHKDCTSYFQQNNLDQSPE